MPPKVDEVQAERERLQRNIKTVQTTLEDYESKLHFLAIDRDEGKDVAAQIEDAQARNAVEARKLAALSAELAELPAA